MQSYSYWPDMDGGGPIPPQLWTYQIERTGYTSGTITLPAIDLNAGTAPDNRADSIYMPIWRLTNITSETGSRTDVIYGGGTTSCTQPAQGWAYNTQWCYPRWTVLDGAAGWGTFNKYVVSSVDVVDTLGISPTMRTSYEYVTYPQYHRDENPLTVNRTSSEYRGMRHVRERSGAAGGTQSVTEYLFYSGMHGDPDGQGGTKTVTFTDSRGSLLTDYWYLQGRPYEVRSNNSLQYEHTAYQAWAHPSNGRSIMTRPSQTFSRTWSAGTGTDPSGWIDTVQQTAWDSNGMPNEERDYGFNATSADDRCTRSAYVPNTTAWILDRPLYRIFYTGSSCTGTANERGTDTYYYDNQGYGNAPVKGNLTIQNHYLAASTAAATTYTYDSAGRVTVVDGPRSTTPNDTVTTTYDTTYGFPRTVTNALGHVTTTVIGPARGQPASTTDANAKTTNLAYDALGRLLWVSMPGDSANATLTYDYSVSKTSSSWIRTGIAQTDTQRLDSWIYHDGMGRQVQSQTSTPTMTGRITATAVYDSRGLVVRSIPDQVYSGLPGTGYAGYYPTGHQREVRASYDAAERPISNGQYSNGSLLWQTTIAYDAFTTTVTPPVGGLTAQKTNASGELAVTREYNASGAYLDTAYGYNAAGQLTSISDPAGVTTSMTYDWGGRRTQLVDPNQGTTTSTYDPAGLLLASTTAAGTLWHGYDSLGRQTERRLDNASGNLQARWVYDAVGHKALLAYSEAFDAAGVRILRTDVVGYDTRNRPTGNDYIVDSRAGWTDNGLAGTYRVSYAYDRADHQTAITYPAAGGLAAETVTTGYNAAGYPTTLTGAHGYVTNATYTPEGKPATRALSNSGTTLTRTYTWDPATYRLTGLSATTGAGTVQNLTYTYDNAGNPTSRTDTVGGERQCYVYNSRHRLEQAYTTTTATACSANQPSSTAGPAPYNHRYTYDSISRITTFGPANGGGPNGINTYTYNAAGHPHAPSAITNPGGTDTYTYDSVGNRTGWVDADGPDYTYTWDRNGRLTGTTNTTTSATSSYLYDTDRSRILQKDSDGTIRLTLGGHLEITKIPAGTILGNRYYDFGGGNVAMRSVFGLEWTLGDERGSPQTTINHSTGTANRILYTPYGQTRATTPAAPDTSRRYLNQPYEPNNQHHYLNNRYYDGQTAVFLAVDPIAHGNDPMSLNSYIYARGNPLTFKDPNGLDPAWAHDRNPCNDAGYYTCISTPSGTRITPGPRQKRELSGFVRPERLKEILPARYRPLLPRAPSAPPRPKVAYAVRYEIEEGERELFRQWGIWTTVERVPGLSEIKNLAEESRLNVTGAESDESNARKHVYLAALLTWKLGEEVARGVLDAHENIVDGELLEGHPLNMERQMDIINNEIGIELGAGFQSDIERQGIDFGGCADCPGPEGYLEDKVANLDVVFIVR